MTPTTDFSDPKLEISSFIREVFGYLKRFKGQLFVLKIEDSLMDNPLFPVLVRDIGAERVRAALPVLRALRDRLEPD